MVKYNYTNNICQGFDKILFFIIYSFNFDQK
nr:MAG TPA: hypothetical protein [Caudoviricetes sp.]